MIMYANFEPNQKTRPALKSFDIEFTFRKKYLWINCARKTINCIFPCYL